MAQGLALMPTSAPSQDLAFKNIVYASPEDVQAMCGGAAAPLHCEVKGCMYMLEGHPKMERGKVGFTKLQREFAKVGLNQEVFVKRFVPPSAFDLGSLSIEVDLFQKPPADKKTVEIKDEEVQQIFKSMFTGQIFAVGQPMALDYASELLRFTITGTHKLDLGDGQPVPKVSSGILAAHTELNLKQGTSGKLHVLSDKPQTRNIFRPDFNFEELGIGGLTKEFGDIFRRAFAARVFPPHVVRDLGIKHVRGMLLYGPPGTGKTLIARQLAKFLQSAEPKVINGPEILNKYVGQSEENIRKLFEDAEKEEKQLGENSQLHIIIFDEIDAICKSRGRSSDSTGVGDSVVNQLLSKIDGVDALNNILLIGMTNRLDMIDEALLRPGRMEVHVEITLPSEAGRIEILNIHTKTPKEKGYFADDVSIEAIAAQSKNFSGAELEGLVRSAVSFAMNRKVNMKDISSKTMDVGGIKVTMADFELALSEIKPLHGQHHDEFEFCARGGIIPYSSDFDKLLATCQSMVEQVRCSENTPLLSVLLSGNPGCGKTALSAHLGEKCDFPFVRRVAAENYVGYSEHAKIAHISKVFDDAYKSSLSVIVLDDLERLMDYVRIGPRFSNNVLQMLMALMKKQPPKEGRRLLVIATTSDPAFLDEADLLRCFNAVLRMPNPDTPESFGQVLRNRPGFSATVVAEISEELRGRRIGIQKIILVAEMAAHRQNPVTKEVFMECLLNAGAD